MKGHSSEHVHPSTSYQNRFRLMDGKTLSHIKSQFSKHKGEALDLLTLINTGFTKGLKNFISYFISSFFHSFIFIVNFQHPSKQTTHSPKLVNPKPLPKKPWQRWIVLSAVRIHSGRVGWREEARLLSQKMCPYLGTKLASPDLVPR